MAPSLHATPRTPGPGALLNKVPEVTAFFWVIKVLATTVGETAADLLTETLGMTLVTAAWLVGAALVVLLVVQVRARRYRAVPYWVSVVLASIVGTLVTDHLVDDLGVSQTLTTVVLALALAATFGAWWLSERTLSIHEVTTTRRELFYWLAVLVTFALGTAAGDLLAEGLSLGYGLSLLLFAGAIVLVVAARLGLGLGAVAAFWSAYVLTRPLGASLGDLLSQPRADGGLGLGTTATSVVFLVAIAALVGHLAVPRRDVAPSGQGDAA